MSIFGGKKKGLFGDAGSSVDEFAVDLNLTPLMDVMSNILFFLMAGFGAAIISYLAATIPVQSESEAPPDAPRTDRVVVNLQMNSDGYKLSASNDKVPPADLAKHKQVLRKRETGGYDNAALTAALMEIKKQYPASDTIMILPAETVVYDEIVSAMEASKGTAKGEQKIRLFPKAVIADLVKADADAPPPVEGTSP